ncbi:universal stress protein [bacterium]|nr:universal stress protein [bacterium]
MKKNILVALNDSMISQSVINSIIEMRHCHNEDTITLLHVFRKPTAEEALMGKKFTAEQKPRMMAALEKFKDKLIENGFKEHNIIINLATEKYETISDGIIDVFKKGSYDMVFIGRKRMSKSEEFVLGDISIRLIRALKNTSIVVVKTE